MLDNYHVVFKFVKQSRQFTRKSVCTWSILVFIGLNLRHWGYRIAANRLAAKLFCLPASQHPSVLAYFTHISPPTAMPEAGFSHLSFCKYYKYVSWPYGDWYKAHLQSADCRHPWQFELKFLVLCQSGMMPYPYWHDLWANGHLKDIVTWFFS